MRSSGRIVGAEALLRWEPPGQAKIFPGEFIPIAEEGWSDCFDRRMGTADCLRPEKVWHDAGLSVPLKVAVNLSARQLKHQDIVKVVSQVLDQLGCRPDWLELEITESVIMENPESAAETLHKLSAMGVHLSSDDFGTGYSSLSYLIRFPINSLMIDRSFVRDITTDAAIARAVIALAHSLKIRVIAEGVETAEQLAFLRSQQCDEMQGYLLSRPVPAAKLEELMALNSSNLNKPSSGH